MKAEKKGRIGKVRKLEGTGYSRWGKDVMESKAIDILIEGAIIGLVRKPALNTVPE